MSCFKNCLTKKTNISQLQQTQAQSTDSSDESWLIESIVDGDGLATQLERYETNINMKANKLKLTTWL